MEKGALSADQDHIRTQEVYSLDIADRTTVSRGIIQTTPLGEERTRPVTRSPGPVGRLVRRRRRPAHRRGCSADFGSGTLVPGGMDWRSLGGLPDGLRVCGDGIVMLFLSGPGKGWGTGGCTAVHAQEVARPTVHRSIS